MANQEFEQTCRILIEEVGLARADEVTAVVPLTGGVASDIARVEVGERVFCVKAALPKLKVAADWFAPVHRNLAEYQWLETATGIAPESVPKLYGQSSSGNGFVMEFVAGSDTYLWKRALLDGVRPNDEAVGVARLLGQVHQKTSQDDFDRDRFQNQDDFKALRLEPYLLFTGNSHPALAPKLTALADQLYESDICLVHGDASPKNILFRSGVPILLDAECATVGDPCFDIAFCLNHLVLKSFHVQDLRSELLEEVRNFWAAYRPLVTWEAVAELEAKLCVLLPALMLARVDGKSPVEYLEETNKSAVRQLAVSLLSDGVRDIDGFLRSTRNFQENP